MFIDLADTGTEEKLLVKNEPWRQTLLKAADVIRRRGHAKRVLEDTAGGVCIMGAINVALHNDASYAPNIPAALEAGSKMSDYISRMGWAVRPDYYFGEPELQAAVNWNNALERTKEEVIATLEAAAVS